MTSRTDLTGAHRRRGAAIRICRAAGMTGLVLAAPLTTSTGAKARDTPVQRWDVKASTRVRYEGYDGGYRPGGHESEDALSMRSSFQVTYRGDGWSAGGEVRDARAYAIDARSPLGAGDIDVFQIAQAWVAFDIGERAKLTAGRMVMDIGSRRIVGDPGFRNAANSFTGLRLDWQGDGNRITAFYTLPDIRLPAQREALLDNAFKFDTERWELRLWGVHAARRIGGVDAELYAIGLDENDSPSQATRNRHIVTVGSRLQAEPVAGLAGEVEAMVQRGTIRTSSAADAAKVPVRAWGFHADLAWTFGHAWKPRVTLFANLGSGDKAGTRAYERFDSLYEPRRGDFGPTSLYGPLGRRNERDIGLRFDVKPSKRFDAFAEWRRIGLVSASDAFAFTRIVDPSGNAGKDAGSQWQMRARYWLVPGHMQLELGGALLDKGEFFRRAPNAPGNGDTRYGYLSASYRF